MALIRALVGFVVVSIQTGRPWCGGVVCWLYILGREWRFREWGFVNIMIKIKNVI